MRKAFEGIYAHGHDFNALSDHVMWLEYHGLNGLDLFLKSCAGLEDWQNPVLSQNESGDLTIDGQGQCILALTDIICDVAVDQALKTQMSIVHISNILNPEVIVSGLSRCRVYGLSGTAWWPGGEDWGHIAVQESDSQTPYLCRISLPDRFVGYDKTTLILAKDLSDIEKRFPEWFAFREGHTVPANEINKTYLNHLDNGFVLSQAKYKLLNKLADRILVEATEESRRGAGA